MTPPLSFTGAALKAKDEGLPNSMSALEVPHSPSEKRKASSGVDPKRNALKSLLLPLRPLMVNSILRSPKNSWLATAKDWPEENASKRPRATFQDSDGAQNPF